MTEQLQGSNYDEFAVCSITSNPLDNAGIPGEQTDGGAAEQQATGEPDNGEPGSGQPQKLLQGLCSDTCYFTPIPSTAEVALRFFNLVEATKAHLLTPQGFCSATVYLLLKDIDELNMDEEADLASIMSLIINISTYRGDHEVKKLGKTLKRGDITLPIFCDKWVAHETECKFAQNFVSQQSATLKPSSDSTSTQKIRDLEASLAKLQKQIEDGGGKKRDSDKKVKDAGDSLKNPVKIYEYDQWDAGTVAKLFDFAGDDGKSNQYCPLCARLSPWKHPVGYPRHDSNHCLAGQQFVKPSWTTQACFDCPARKAALGNGAIHRGPTMILNKSAPIKQQGHAAQQTPSAANASPPAKTYTLEEIQKAHSDGFAQSQQEALVASQAQQPTQQSPVAQASQAAQSFGMPNGNGGFPPPPQWGGHGGMYQHNFGVPGYSDSNGGTSTPY